MENIMIYIGIDTGVNTGIAVWNKRSQKFDCIKTVPIHIALQMVKIYDPVCCHIRVEDARKRKQFAHKKGSKEAIGVLQGVGSVKRDAKIWEDFLLYYGYSFEMTAPAKGITKLSQNVFTQMTGITDKLDTHSIDAAMLVYKK